VIKIKFNVNCQTHFNFAALKDFLLVLVFASVSVADEDDEAAESSIGTIGVSLSGWTK